MSKTDATLSDTFVIKVGDENREIFMSYQMVNYLASYVGNVETAISMQMDVSMQRLFVQHLLAPLDDHKRPTFEGFNFEELKLNTKDVLDLATWAQEHVISFLLETVARQVQIANKFQDQVVQFADRVTALPSTRTGSAVSDGKTASA